VLAKLGKNFKGFAGMETYFLKVKEMIKLQLDTNRKYTLPQSQESKSSSLPLMSMFSAKSLPILSSTDSTQTSPLVIPHKTR
jgi:hypothetical protein